MRPELGSATERGEAATTGRCQICNNEGPLVVVPDAPPPNRLCELCATEYGLSLPDTEEPTL